MARLGPFMLIVAQKFDLQFISDVEWLMHVRDRWICFVCYISNYFEANAAYSFDCLNRCSFIQSALLINNPVLTSQELILCHESLKSDVPHL